MSKPESSARETVPGEDRPGVFGELQVRDPLSMSA